MNPQVKPYSLDTDNFERYGKDQPVNIWEADPVQCVIDGPDGVNKLFTCNRATRLPLGFARAFMAQRCSQSWDGYCWLYANQEMQADFTHKKFNEFIKDTLSRMFCQNDTSIPGAQCVERCEMFNPTSSSSAQVCETQGDLVYRESEKVYALDTNYTQYGKLQTASPIRFTKCPKVCNLFDADALSDKNVALNIALDRGIAMDLIENLVINIVAHKKQDMVTNGRLKDFMNKFVMDGTVKPGFSSVGGLSSFVSSVPISVPAVSPSIPNLAPDEAVVVNDLQPMTGPRMIVAKPSVVRENYVALGSSNPNNNWMYVILIIALIAAVCCFLAYRNK